MIFNKCGTRGMLDILLSVAVCMALTQFLVCHSMGKGPKRAPSHETVFDRMDYKLPFPVYFINMDTAKDRRIHMERDFSALLGNLTRVSAIDPRNRTQLRHIVGPGQISARVVKHVSHSPKHYNEGSIRTSYSFSELGCTLSHLLTIRQAYLEGHNMALILEDDITPMLMPFWTKSIPELIDEADAWSQTEDTPRRQWSVLQLGWIWGKDASIYETDYYLTRRVLPMEFQYGTSAYVISRYGMEAILDAYFSSRAATGKVRLLRNVDVTEAYFEKIPNVLVVVPSLFTVRGFDTGMVAGDAATERNNQHKESNRRHVEATLQLYYRTDAPWAVSLNNAPP